MEYIQTLRDYYCYEPLTGKVFWSKRSSNRAKLFSEAGAKNAQGYVVSSLLGKQNLIHRVIFEMLLGRKLESSEAVDHINGVKDDNRLENLRLGTHSDNSRAFRTKSKGKTSEYRGVHKLERRNKVMWKAAIQSNGKIITKHKKTEREAAIAYDEMATELGWPAECLNFKSKKGGVK